VGYRHSGEMEYNQENVLKSINYKLEDQNDWTKENDEESKNEDEDDEMSMISDISENGIQTVLQK
jgi:hypothetical protein